MVSAVKYPWGEVVTGRRHRNAYNAMADRGIVNRAGCIEGFVGKSGTFYSRAQAKDVAINFLRGHDPTSLSARSRLIAWLC